MVALAAFGAAWSYMLGPLVPRPLMYAFQPSLALLGVILLGLWLAVSSSFSASSDLRSSSPAICCGALAPPVDGRGGERHAHRRRHVARAAGRVAVSGSNEIIHQAMR